MKKYPMTKGMLAMICVLALCLSGVAMADGESGTGERVQFDAAGFSLEVPEGWIYRDLADEANEQAVETGQSYLGLIYVGDPSGVSLVSFVVQKRSSDSDPSEELALYEEAYPESEWVEIGGVSFFTYENETRMKYALGFTEDKLFMVYGEVLNDTFEAQFDELLSTFELL